MAVEVRELDLSKADYSDIADQQSLSVALCCSASSQPTKNNRRIKLVDHKVSDFDLLVKALRSDGRYRRVFLYRGFDGQNISRLLKTGRDSGRGKTIFAVSDLKHFEEGLEEIDRVFKNPKNKLEALVAVYKLKK